MRIDGNYTFVAPCELLWPLLHDPATIQRAVPGCEQFYQQDDGQYYFVFNLPTGPLCGRYAGTVTLSEDRPQETLTLSMTGSGPESVFTGQGMLTLVESQGQTMLFYEGDVDVSGQIPTQSPRLIGTTVNFLIRSFLEALDRQICQITGTAGQNALPPADGDPIERSTPTIGMQDFFAELRRDRWIAAVVFVLALLALFSLLGVVFVGLLALRWVTRSLTDRVSSQADDELPAELPAKEA